MISARVSPSAFHSVFSRGFAFASVVVGSLACAHCGSQDFSGTYQGTLTTTVTCPNEGPESTEAPAYLVFTQTSNTIDLGLSVCPNAQAIVNGRVADVQTITCPTQTDSEGAIAGIAFTGGTISLPADSVVIVDILANTITGVAPSVTTCTTTISGVFRKV